MDRYKQILLFTLLSLTCVQQTFAMNDHADYYRDYLYRQKKLFFKAIKEGDVKRVKSFLQLKIDLNSRDNFWREASPLECAISRFDPGLEMAERTPSIPNLREIVRLLLAAGANFETKNKHGRTVLHDAVTYRNPELVRLLLDANADVNSKDDLGATPLHRILSSISDYGTHRRRHNEDLLFDLQIVEMLLKAGANSIAYKDDQTLIRVMGKTPLGMAEDFAENLAIYFYDELYVPNRLANGGDEKLTEKVIEQIKEIIRLLKNTYDQPTHIIRITSVIID